MLYVQRRRSLTPALLNAVEQRLREPVIADRPVVAFDVGVLLRFPRLSELELNTPANRPLSRRLH